MQFRKSTNYHHLRQRSYALDIANHHKFIHPNKICPTPSPSLLQNLSHRFLKLQYRPLLRTTKDIHNLKLLLPLPPHDPRSRHSLTRRISSPEIKTVD